MTLISGLNPANALDLNAQRCDDGWADYAFEGHSGARAKIGDYTFYIPDELRRRGEFIWGELRGFIR